MKKCWLAWLMLCLFPFCALADALPFYDYSWQTGEIRRKYESDSLRYTVEPTRIYNTKCFVTKVWMQEPGLQIKKSTAAWREGLALVETMGYQVSGAALVINGSGYVSPTFPEIPDNYPGESADYYYTPLGSVTVTDGEVFRCLDGVPYYGLTLEVDGLHMHRGTAPAQVLSTHPTQTWSFYEKCPLIENHQSVLDEQWAFAGRRATRTIIAKMDDNNYLILTATDLHGLTLMEAVQFLTEEFDPIWAYNLDGGPSSALLCRNVGKKTLKTIFGGKRKDADIMAFVELPE